MSARNEGPHDEGRTTLRATSLKADPPGAQFDAPVDPGILAGRPADEHRKVPSPARRRSPRQPLELVIELPRGIDLEQVDSVVLVELVDLADGGVSRARMRFAA